MHPRIHQIEYIRNDAVTCIQRPPLSTYPAYLLRISCYAARPYVSAATLRDRTV